MARTQTLIQLSGELLAQLDARAAREGISRSELIRRALDGFLRQDVEAAIDRQVVESYTRRSQEDLLGAELTARGMIEAEPWSRWTPRDLSARRPASLRVEPRARACTGEG